MAISSRVPKCPYCGERIPIISNKPFDGAIYPDWKGHNEICKFHPLNKKKESQLPDIVEKTLLEQKNSQKFNN